MNQSRAVEVPRDGFFRKAHQLWKPILGSVVLPVPVVGLGLGPWLRNCGAVCLALPLLLAGCAGSGAPSKPVNRTAETPSIIEAVLRYELREFAAREGGPDGVVCVAVREGGVLMDPKPDLLLKLGGFRVHPQSACKEAQTLVVGPVDWVRDDEVRVSGGRIRASQGESRIAYRVVREDDRWVCVGPVIASDPL